MIAVDEVRREIMLMLRGDVDGWDLCVLEWYYK